MIKLNDMLSNRKQKKFLLIGSMVISLKRFLYNLGSSFDDYDDDDYFYHYSYHSKDDDKNNDESIVK